MYVVYLICFRIFCFDTEYRSVAMALRDEALEAGYVVEVDSFYVEEE